MVKNQVWFTTDMGFEATKSKLLDSKELIGDGQDWKGMLTFHLKNFKDFTIQITTAGKLSITYPENADTKVVLEKVKPFLTKADGTPAKIIRKITPKPKAKIEPKSEPNQPQKENKTTSQQTKTVIETLYFLLMRNPTLLEIAYQVGKPPENIRETVFSLAPTTDWKEPTQKEIDEAERRLCEIYQIAALLRQFKPEVVLTRPPTFLRGKKCQEILKRALYAQEYEKAKIPTVEIEEETNQAITYSFRWPIGAKINFSDVPEYYDKKTSTLSGQQRAIGKIFKPLLNEVKKSLSNEQ